MPGNPLDAKAIFNVARRIDCAAARAEYLRQISEGDVGLVNRVTALLHGFEQHSSFLESPAMDGAATIMFESCPERPGTQIGPYKLLEQIGTGGMGAVYVAEQKEPVRRKVALKVIKPGMDTRQVVARFEAERQALALMNHPNIAKVLDAGATDAGRPYFVMELVKGAPITEFCDQQKLDTRERLQLFIAVCQAVQHAHQKGLIHRDIKPSNVLVEMHDVLPVPKVIDFGVAKAIGQSLTDKTLHTGFDQMVGTPLYMSPEQAGQSSIDVDTRSDIYSLGVLLYEILTGHTPFERDTLRDAGFDEMRRMIREVDPPRPSARVSTLEAKVLSTVSDCRKIESRRLSQQLRGELDWIVMKTLEKDRNRRYESANALAADVQRYLDDEPVMACPPSTVYRFQKYARRHKGLLAVSIAILTGTVFSLWQAVEAIQARKLADDRLVLANDRLENEELARADAVKQRELASANLQRALEVVDQMLMRVADERLGAIPGTEPVRQELFQEALRFYEGFFEQIPDDPKLQLSMAQAWWRIGSLHYCFSNFTQAQAARQEAIHRWEDLHAANPDDPEIQHKLAQVCHEFGLCEHWFFLKWDSAEAALTRAISLWQDLERRYPDNPDYQSSPAGAANTLADTYKNTNRTDLAEKTLRDAVEVQRRLWARAQIGGKHKANATSLCFSLTGLAEILALQKESDKEIEELYVEAVRCGEDFVASDPQSGVSLPSLVWSTLVYGEFLLAHGRVEEAERQFRRACESAQRLPRSDLRYYHDSHFLPRTQLALARLLSHDGRYCEAFSLYRAVSDMTRPIALLPERHTHWERLSSAADQGLFSSLAKMAISGQLDEARKFCEELSQTADTESTTPKFHNNFAWFLATCPSSELRDVGQALKSARKATELEPNIGAFWNTLGVVLYRAGDWPTAVTALEKSMELRTGGDSFDWFFLAMAHWQLGDKEQARKWYDQAVVWMDKNQPQNEELLGFRTEAEELLKD